MLVICAALVAIVVIVESEIVRRRNREGRL